MFFISNIVVKNINKINVIVKLKLVWLIFWLIIIGIKIIISISNKMKIIIIYVKFIDKFILKLLILLNLDSRLFI